MEAKEPKDVRDICKVMLPSVWKWFDSLKIACGITSVDLNFCWYILNGIYNSNTERGGSKLLPKGNRPFVPNSAYN